MYAVYQDGRPATAKEFEFNSGFGWDTNVFETFEEAEEYAILWAYPINRNQLREQNLIIKMELNVPINMSTSQFPVMMEIREI